MFLNRFSLVKRFWAAMLVFWGVFVLAVAAGVWGLMLSKTSLEQVYANRMTTMAQVDGMIRNFYNTRQHVLLAFQHDPNGPLYALHDHPVSSHLEVMRENMQHNGAARRVLSERITGNEELRLYEQATAAQAEWKQVLDEVIRHIEANNFAPEVMHAFLIGARTKGDGAVSALHTLQQYQMQRADNEVQLAEQRYHQGLWLFAAIAVLGALPVTIVLLLALRRLTNGLSVVDQAAQAVAQGDLTHTISADQGKDEISQLLAQTLAMQHNLRGLLTRIRQSAGTLSEVTGQVADSSWLLSERTDQQASSLQQTSAASEELNSTVQQNAANAQEAEHVADQAAQAARRGGQTVDTVIATMNEISDSSQKISDIVGIIDSIAFQTNILALNAAVEAARAGEQGRGFAVVASEVRALAQRSSSAANEIKGLIENSVHVVNEGSTQVTAAGQSMQQIVTTNERMTALIGEIANASKEQSLGLSQINQAITLMDDTTHQNVVLVEQTNQAASVLRTQAEDLMRAVAAFNLGNQSPTTIDTTHTETQITSAEVETMPHLPNATSIRRLS